MNWHGGRLCVFDTETTGKDPRFARIVTACVANVGGGLSTQVNKWLVDPGVEIPVETTEIHGVTTEQARAEGQQPAVAVREIVFQLSAAWSNGWPVVAFNGAYDFTVLHRECMRHGAAFPEVGPIIDPYVIDRHVDPYRRGSRKLVDVCAHYGVRIDNAHDAAGDAVAAGRVAWAIARRYPEIAAMPLRELHAAQVQWHAERQQDFAEYLRRTGKPADDVSGEWPWRAVGADEVEALPIVVSR